MDTGSEREALFLQGAPRQAAPDAVPPPGITGVVVQANTEGRQKPPRPDVGLLRLAGIPYPELGGGLEKIVGQLYIELRGCLQVQVGGSLHGKQDGGRTAAPAEGVALQISHNGKSVEAHSLDADIGPPAYGRTELRVEIYRFPVIGRAGQVEKNYLFETVGIALASAAGIEMALGAGRAASQGQLDGSVGYYRQQGQGGRER